MAGPNGSVLASATGDHWSNGGAYATQIYAHDVGVVGWDNETSSWSGRLPGTDGSKNEHYRVWNLPLRAIAAGTVIAVFDGLDDNTVLGQFASPTPNPGDGNSAWVQFADGTKVVYTHMKSQQDRMTDEGQVLRAAAGYVSRSAIAFTAAWTFPEANIDDTALDNNFMR